MYRDDEFDKWWTAEPVSEFEGVDAGHVERAFAAGRKAEREECAKECEDFVSEVQHKFANGAFSQCADAIRKRSNV